METGCQNIQLCTTILKLAFPPEVIGPLFLFPMIYILFQGAEGLFIVFIFRIYERLNPSTEDPRKNVEYEEGMVKVGMVNVS